MHCEWTASVSDPACTFSSQTKRNADHSRHGRGGFHLWSRHFDTEHLSLVTAVAWTAARVNNGVVLFFEKALIDCLFVKTSHDCRHVQNIQLSTDLTRHCTHFVFY